MPILRLAQMRLPTPSLCRGCRGRYADVRLFQVGIACRIASNNGKNSNDSSHEDKSNIT